MEAVVLQHVSCEGPALIEDALRAAGARVRVVRLDRAEPAPVAGQFDILVARGGPMGALDDDAHPYLASEREIILHSVVSGVPVLGVCLGAQLLAVALGGRIRPRSTPASGSDDIDLTFAGRIDPVFIGLGASVRGINGHGDTFGLPPDATLLARSDQHPSQIFRIGASYGLQFQVEVARFGARILERWAKQAVAVADTR